MPTPRKGEDKKSFIARFMESAEARADFPENSQRLAVAYSMYSKKENASDRYGRQVETPWPKKYMANYIEPGVVAYQDLGPCKVCGNAYTCGNAGDECQPEGATVLVKQDALERMSKSLVGKPVIDVEHKDVTADTVINGEADGIVTAVRQNENGWWECDFLVWNPVTQSHCDNGEYSVSCAYNPTKTSQEGGEWHNVPYAEEILDGEMTHLAIVTNPRYEGARITLSNSKGGKMDWKLFKRGERKNAASLDPLKTKVNVDGSEVALQDLYEAAKEHEAPILNDDTIMEVDGKEKTLGELKQAYRNKMKKNAEQLPGESIKTSAPADAGHAEHDEGKGGFEHEGSCDHCRHPAFNAAGEGDGEKKPLPDLRRTNDEGGKKGAHDEAEEAAMKNAADAAAKAAEEKKNAEEKAKAKADEELKAAADKADEDKKLEEKRNAGRRAFAALRNARDEHVGEAVKITSVSIDERLARGKSKYGSPA